MASRSCGYGWRVPERAAASVGGGVGPLGAPLPFSRSLGLGWGMVGAHPTHLPMADKPGPPAALGSGFPWCHNALARQTRRLTRIVTGRLVLH